MEVAPIRFNTGTMKTMPDPLLITYLAAILVPSPYDHKFTALIR